MALGVIDFIWDIVRLAPWTMDSLALRTLKSGLNDYVMSLFQWLFEGAVLLGFARLINHKS